MTTTQKISNFAKQILARLKQDQDQVVVLKNQRKADAALNSQISALESKLVDQEAVVDDKEEALNNAKYPTTLITDNQSFVQNIVRANAALESAKADLEATKASIEFFKALKVENNEEVDA